MDIIQRVDSEPKENLVGEWLKKSDIVLLYAMRGVGKTYICSYLAHSFASNQKFLGYPCVRSKIIYFDGEMGNRAFKERFNQIDLNPDNDSGIVSGFFFSHHFDDNQNQKAWNLSTFEGQAMYDKKIEECEADIIFLDNYNCLTRKIDARDNDFDMWLRVEEWLIKKRTQGKTVILIHHAGKSGQQLGTSQRENAVDLMIGLKYTGIDLKKGYSGLEFLVEKTRGIHKDKIKEKFCQFTIEDNKFKIEFENLHKKKRDEVIRLDLAGLKKTEIATKLKIEQFIVSEILIENERRNSKWI